MNADMCAIARNAIQQPYLLFSPADADVVQKYFTLAAMTMTVKFYSWDCVSDQKGK